MKQIIPFKKDLLLKTKVSEITSISLEHEYKINNDLITGVFHINGDYKMTDGSINREKFDFELPFDIALDSRYKEDTMVVDIDNFNYQIVNDDTLEVHIDLYVDGEKEEIIEDIKTDDIVEDNEEVISVVPEMERVTYEDLVEDNNSDEDIDIDIDNVNINDNDNTNINKLNDFNIFDNVSDSETYKAYYVYIVKEGDNLDKILEKYSIDKEELSLYNDIDNINTGDKIIIPSKNE